VPVSRHGDVLNGPLDAETSPTSPTFRQNSVGGDFFGLSLAVSPVAMAMA
jgi:hypothetical protein